jgi:hypothetical protein
VEEVLHGSTISQDYWKMLDQENSIQCRHIHGLGSGNLRSSLLEISCFGLLEKSASRAPGLCSLNNNSIDFFNRDILALLK